MFYFSYFFTFFPESFVCVHAIWYLLYSIGYGYLTILLELDTPGLRHSIPFDHSLSFWFPSHPPVQRWVSDVHCVISSRSRNRPEVDHIGCHRLGGPGLGRVHNWVASWFIQVQYLHMDGDGGRQKPRGVDAATSRRRRAGAAITPDMLCRAFRPTRGETR